MKGSRSAIGFLLVVLLFGVVLIGCSKSDDVSVRNLGGVWDVRIVYDDGSIESWIFDIVQDGDSLSGTSVQVNESESVALTGTISGDMVEIIEHWGNPNFVYRGTITSDSKMNGTCAYADGSFPGTWVGMKR